MVKTFFSLSLFLNLSQFLSPSLSLSSHDDTSNERETVREKERRSRREEKKNVKIWLKKLHFMLPTPGGEPRTLVHFLGALLNSWSKRRWITKSFRTFFHQIVDTLPPCPRSF